ncbi:DUF1592 domain-containing protein [Paraliomyxa miuraensis]|uniref:DUF1592 domain-containing protein n=1 Tax=Paraliomyxa miuraensis TaxID=376150 RepID=UPI00224EEF9B|nr:DUF1592 domain-containing protein [Paraliomyxa miuraensis]MCX4246247.1 DUF1592 domain-containing protein [Paraliomyxa miuraensis]
MKRSLRRFGPLAPTLCPVLCLVALVLPAAGCKDDPEGDGGTDSATGTGGSVGEEGVDETADGTGTSGGLEELDVTPAPGGMRRLTPTQYVRSVEVILGEAAAAAANPPPMPQLGHFDSQTAVDEPLTPVDIETYESSSMAIGNAIMNDPSGLAVVAPCVNLGGDDCYELVARDLGRLAWRRPVLDEEVTTLVAIANAAREWGEGDFMSGIKYEVAAILQSPNFLYVVEVGQPTGEGDVRELDPYELASRMSFFFVGHTPDADLLDLAEAGGLSTNGQLENVAYDLLERPEARARLAEFYDELYRLRDLQTKGKDAVLFPTFSSELAAAMRQETLLLIQNVVFEEEANFLSIFDASYTFVNDDLAQLYGMDPPAYPWQLVPMPVEQGRAGILTQPAFLTVFSHPDINSPTRRGLFVQETLLCNEIQPPPPGVMANAPTPAEGQTLRQWLEQVHNAEDSCAGCHSLMDPVGFAFERFSPIGAFRQLDNGLPIDSSGEVAGVGTFGSAADLATLVRNDPRTPICVVRNLYRSTLGHEEGPDQFDGLMVLDESFASTNFDYKALMVELTKNPLFRLVDAPK